MEEEKHQTKEVVDNHGFAPEGADEEVGIVNKSGPLKQDLQGRHMQMIAIGTSCSPSTPVLCPLASLYPVLFPFVVVGIVVVSIRPDPRRPATNMRETQVVPLVLVSSSVLVVLSRPVALLRSSSAT